MFDLSILVADPLVELHAFHTDVVLSRLQDATFGGDGPGSIDVVSSHHADSDAGPLALFDGVRYLTRTTLLLLIIIIKFCQYHYILHIGPLKQSFPLQRSQISPRNG